jgi:hypothetical protein
MRQIGERLLSRIEAMEETLHSEWGAEQAYFRMKFQRELAEHALDLALDLLEVDRRLQRHVEKWRTWRRSKLTEPVGTPTRHAVGRRQSKR